MNEDIVRIIWFVGALVLVGSALLHRGLDKRGALKLAMIWVGIIGVAWAAVSITQRAQDFFAQTL